jgi:phenylacetic acid degradation operon negative regulatory protein
MTCVPRRLAPVDGTPGARHPVEPEIAPSVPSGQNGHSSASVLLGVDPPRLSSRHLVRAGQLFGIEAGTTRVALSRMVAAGELESDEGTYQLAGPLLERHARQEQSRSPATIAWSGDWTMAAVPSGRRDASTRSELRAAAEALRLAELREGVWLRPDNLPPGRLPEAESIVGEQCRRFVTQPESPVELVAELWDLDAWATTAAQLRGEMEHYVVRLEQQDTAALAPAFGVAAAVVRHFVNDPILPSELLPRSWPGAALRDEYDRYETTFTELWRQALRA